MYESNQFDRHCAPNHFPLLPRGPNTSKINFLALSKPTGLYIAQRSLYTVHHVRLISKLSSRLYKFTSLDKVFLSQ